MKKKFFERLYIILPIFIFELFAVINVFFGLTNDRTNNFTFIVSLFFIFIGPFILYDELTMFDKKRK